MKNSSSLTLHSQYQDIARNAIKQSKMRPFPTDCSTPQGYKWVTLLEMEVFPVNLSIKHDGNIVVDTSTTLDKAIAGIAGFANYVGLSEAPEDIVRGITNTLSDCLKDLKVELGGISFYCSHSTGDNVLTKIEIRGESGEKATELLLQHR